MRTNSNFTNKRMVAGALEVSRDGSSWCIATDDDGIDSWQAMIKDRVRGWNISIRRLAQMYNMTILFDTSASGSIFEVPSTPVSDNNNANVSTLEIVAQFIGILTVRAIAPGYLIMLCLFDSSCKPMSCEFPHASRLLPPV